MNDGVGILPAQCRQYDQAYISIAAQRSVYIMRPAVHRHVMSAFREPRATLLGECFKASIVRRNPARSQNGDFHPIKSVSPRTPYLRGCFLFATTRRERSSKIET